MKSGLVVCDGSSIDVGENMALNTKLAFIKISKRMEGCKTVWK